MQQQPTSVHFMFLFDACGFPNAFYGVEYLGTRGTDCCSIITKFQPTVVVSLRNCLVAGLKMSGSGKHVGNVYVL